MGSRWNDMNAWILSNINFLKPLAKKKEKKKRRINIE
jgi:hypothetical protein